MKLQWSIQSSHTQITRSQVTYLTSRNEHIWLLTKVFTLIENFSFGFLFHTFLSIQLNFWAMMPWNFLYFFEEKAFGFGIIYFEYILFHIFIVKLVFEAMPFQLFLFLEIDAWRTFWHKNKCEVIYRSKSTHVSRSNKTTG